MSALRAEPLTPERVAALRAQIRANFFVPDPLPALDAKTHRRFSPAPGVAAEAVTYATEFGMRVPAILYLPDPLPKGKIPGFIVVNGHGGDKYSWYSYYAGISFARGGAAVLTYDQAGEGERNSERKSVTREHDQLQGDATMARRLFGLMLTDIIQGTSYLASRPEVDPRRLGAGGYSMGSFVMAIGGAVEPRLHAVVLAAGGNISGAGDYWDSSPKLMCQGLPSQSLRFLGDQAAVLYALQAARGPLLIRNGRIDQVITPQKTFEPFFENLQTRVAALHGSREGVFEFGFKEGTGHRPYFLEQPAVLWLERLLDFPNWTEAQIRALPEIHISEWAKQQGVEVDGSLANEEREGGTMAVGGNVPGYRHEDLSVFTPAEWERHKHELTFAAWTAAANSSR
ncbi:MAG TPA: prolyl oligopeptidase family serine peptidase [Opitutaceae bacterium]|nr:prolyl oligopeptidase family serine peptidase [Opitutaceae bacterium]